MDRYREYARPSLFDCAQVEKALKGKKKEEVPPADQYFSILELCSFMETDAQHDNDAISKRISALLKAGHACRNALCSFAPLSVEREKVLDAYDKAWLGSIND